jgi:hypothetical protein
MRPGHKAVVQPIRLYSNHPGIRFDKRQGSAAAQSAPRGASGQVLQVSNDGNEFLVELYWNGSSAAAAGHVWYIWVKREWFGQLLVA